MALIDPYEQNTGGLIDPFETQAEPQPEQEKGFFTRVGEDVKKRASAIWEDDSHVTRFPGESGLRIGGQIAGMGNDLIGQGIKSAYKTIVPQVAQDVLASGTRNVAEYYKEPMQDMASGYARFKQENPNAAKDIEGGANILGFVPMGKGAQVAGKEALNVAHDIASVMPKPGSKLIPKVTKEIIGATTGAGPGAVEEAIKGADSFVKAMRGQISGDEIVENAKGALNAIVQKRGNEYRQLLAKVSENKTPIDINEIKTEVTENLKNFVKYNEAKQTGRTITNGVAQWEVVKYPNGGGYALKNPVTGKYETMKSGHAVYYQSEETAKSAAERMMQDSAKNQTKQILESSPGHFDWERTSVGNIRDSKDAKELSHIYNKIQQWGIKPGDNTAVELDRLRRDLDNHWSDSSRVRAFVQHARDSVNKAIKKSVPEYTDMTKGYTDATRLIKDIESGLMMRKQGMTGRITADQTLRRLTSAMRENFELRRELVDALGAESGQDIAAQVAGYAMSQGIPRGLVGKMAAGTTGYLAFMNPKMWPLLAASSPRVMGEFLNVYGKATRALKSNHPPGMRSLAGKKIEGTTWNLGSNPIEPFDTPTVPNVPRKTVGLRSTMKKAKNID